MVRGKVRLSSITEHYWGGRTLQFEAIYDDSIPEDRRFAKATPSATFTMQVDNPAALEEFKIGKFYYVDFIGID